MTFALSTPVTGGLQTNMTAPTYTLTADTPPSNNGKQWAVTALGGTQTGVIAHSVAAPFTIAQFRPQNLQVLKPLNNNGQLDFVPKNTFKTVVRKGVLPLAGQAYRPLIATLTIECPAGADTADPANVRAALSLLIGSVNQQSAGLGDSVVSGLI